MSETKYVILRMSCWMCRMAEMLPWSKQPSDISSFTSWSNITPSCCTWHNTAGEETDSCISQRFHHQITGCISWRAWFFNLLHHTTIGVQDISIKVRDGMYISMISPPGNVYKTNLYYFWYVIVVIMTINGQIPPIYMYIERKRHVK